MPPESKIPKSGQELLQFLISLLPVESKPSLLSGDTVRKRVWGLLLSFFSLHLRQDLSSQLECEEPTEENSAQQLSRVYNLITCFICCSLFLNQSGWMRERALLLGAIIYTSLLYCCCSSNSGLPLYCICHTLYVKPFNVCCKSFVS